MLPFGAEQFFGVFAEYNRAIWPVQIVAYAFGGVAVAMALLSRLHRLVAAALAAMWLWTGIGYHWIFFAVINPVAFGFGALFVLQAALLIWIGTVRGELAFRRPACAMRLALSLLLVGYAMVLYPLIGAWTGHRYPAAPAFGVTPCPVTIFSFGLLALAEARPLWRWLTLAVPVLWAIIGGSAAVLLGVQQDWMLPVAAVLTLASTWAERHRPPATAAEPRGQSSASRTWRS